MPLRWLPTGPPPTAPRPGLAGAAHESRLLLDAMLDGDASALLPLRAVYDGQAADWTAWCADQPDYLLPLTDALDRLDPSDDGWVLEVSAGTGQATAVLSRRFARVLATDPSLAMIEELAATAGSNVAAVVAESEHLPLPARSVSLVVGLNAVPDLAEFRRVLRPGGAVLWVSSFGEETPLYIPPAELAVEWVGPAVAATAGHGDWLMLG